MSSFGATRPNQVWVPQQTPLAGIALPPGWEARLDPQGRVYYADHSTRRTTYQHPYGLAFSASPPVPPHQQPSTTYQPQIPFWGPLPVSPHISPENSQKIPTENFQNFHIEKSQKNVQEKFPVQDVPSQVTFNLNGKPVTINNPSLKMTLNDYLREQPNTKGTKKVCGEGGCGACTVTLTRMDNTLNKQTHEAINSCLRPICSINGMSITTVEGIGSQKKGFHPVQERIAECNGTQCGYCTPGMVMSMYSLLQENSSPTEKEVEDRFDGNLCRCTGYRSIFTAVKSFAGDSCGDLQKCTQKPPLLDIEDLRTQKPPRFEEYEHHKHPSPVVLQSKNAGKCLKVSDGGATWYTPTSLSMVYSLLDSNKGKDIKLMTGNTSIGIYKDQHPDVIIDVSNLADLSSANLTASGALFGSAVTISNMIDLLSSWAKSTSYAPYQLNRFDTLVKHMQRIANFPVRNIASWAGNVMLCNKYKNFPSDMFTILYGAGALLSIGSSQGVQQEVDFGTFINLDMTGKVILSVTIPFGQQGDFFSTYKIAIRHQNSHALINAALYAQVGNDFIIKSQPRLVFGGVLGYAIRMTNTEKSLIGANVKNPDTLKNALLTLQNETNPIPGPGRVTYRKSLVTSFFYKFFLSLQPSLPPQLQSAVETFERPVSFGSQSYQTSNSEWPVSEPIPKLAGKQQASGEAVYSNDVPSQNGTLYAALVGSTVASATIQSIDSTEALAMPGVKAFFSASDITADRNVVQPFLPDEQVFASPDVSYYGQCIGLVVADSQPLADEAAKMIKVTYINVKKPILTVEDAIQANSFYDDPISPVVQGSVTTGFAQSAVVLEGSVSIGSQAHFHMETHSVYCIPEEMGTMKIIGATQWTSASQSVVAHVLGKADSQITVEVRRLGGGYGGKITRNFIPFCATAFASDTLGVPVKMHMTLNTNLEMVGKRHPITCNYKIGLDTQGKAVAVQMMLYLNQGAATDGGSAGGVVLTAFQTIDNCYKFPNFSVDSKLCKTNIPPNTACRGPGWTQAIFIMEHIMEHVASSMKISPDVIRERNFYSKGDVTPVAQKLVYWNIPQIWDQVKTMSDYTTRVSAIQAFNAANRWIKKGIALVPIKFGIGWATAYHSTTVQIYADGTLNVSTTGIEMGQGLNTKVAQAVAMSLGVPMSKISVLISSTTTNPNSIPTGGSIGSELCVKAALKACEVLNKRLSPLRKNMVDPTWENLVQTALSSGVDLQAKGFVDPSNNPPNGPNVYNTYGAVCIEVQVDVLTGEIQLLRSDILFDCGQSTNPAIDIGQVEGAFVQGLGLHLTEEVLYTPDGVLINNGTWEYKPPSSQDIPIEFNIALLKNVPNPVGILGAKAVGEPPLSMSCAALFAAQHAIANARNEIGHGEYFEFDSPCTVDRIQQTCLVNVSQFTMQ